MTIVTDEDLQQHDRFVGTVDQLRQAARNAIDAYGDEIARWCTALERRPLDWPHTKLYPSAGQGAKYQTALTYHDRCYAAYCALIDKYAQQHPHERADMLPLSLPTPSDSEPSTH
jgi:hypothetical protein